MKPKSESLLALILIIFLGAMFLANAAKAQCDLGPEIQAGVANISYDGSGTFEYTDQGDPGDFAYAGLPMTNDCAALVSASSGWIASLHVSLAAETLVASAEDEPYVKTGLFVIVNGDVNNTVYVALEQLNYSGHSDDGNVYGGAAIFEAVENNRNIRTTAVGGAKNSSGTSYLEFFGNTSAQPVTKNIGTVSGLLTLSYNPVNKMLTGSFNGRAFGEISLGAFGANPSIGLYVAGASGGSVVVNTGTAEADALKITVPPPTFTITAPANNTVVAAATPTVALEGTFNDANGVSGIWCAVNGDTNNAVEVDTLSAGPKSGRWSGSLDLSQTAGAAPGKNILSLWAVNADGVASAVVTRTVTWTLTTKLTLGISPSSAAGKARGLANGQTLVVGKAYPVLAVANSGWAFWKWTDGNGNILATNAGIDFVADVSPANVDQGIGLTANFVPSPYPLVAGTYDGLFSVPGSLTPTNTGYISVTVTKTGAYSGSVMFESRTARPISGQLDLASQFESGDPTALASPVAVVSKTYALGLTLKLSGLTNGAAPALGGVVNLYNLAEKKFVWPTSANIDAKLVATSNNLTEGLYNFVLPAVATNPAQGPAGWSFGTATLGRNGGVAVTLTLADGVTPASSQATGVAGDGTFPIYLPLYGGDGLMFGWMQFTPPDAPTEYLGAPVDVESTNLSWFASTEKYYPAGFAADAGSFLAFGARYVAPKAGTNIFGTTNPTFQLDGGMNDQADTPLVFNPRREALTVVPPNPNHLTLHFNSSTGAFTGSESIGGKTISGKGVLLPYAQAYGFYIGTGKTDVGANQSGPITIYGPQAIPGDQ